MGEGACLRWKVCQRSDSTCKMLPFPLLKSNSHHLCSSLTSLSLSWHRDIHRLGTFLIAAQCGSCSSEKQCEAEQQKKWQWCSIITFFSCCFSATTTFTCFFKALMSFLWTFCFSNKRYFVCVRSVCHWSAYLPCRVNENHRYFCSQHWD